MDIFGTHINIIMCTFLMVFIIKKYFTSYAHVYNHISFSDLSHRARHKKCTASLIQFGSFSRDFDYDNSKHSAYQSPFQNRVSSYQESEKKEAEKQVPLRHSGHINITKFPIDKTAIVAIPAKVVWHYKFMPLEIRDGILKIAVSNLNNITLLDDLKIFLGYEVMPFLAREEDIIAAINQYYGIGAETIEGIINNVIEEQPHDTATNDISAFHTVNEITTHDEEEAAIIKFVNKIFFDAYEARSTDIHIEPYDDQLRIRYRIDGELVQLKVPQELIHLKSSIISRIKIMAKLDIAERRLPQDGRIKVKINNRVLDLRVAILPTAYGESIDVRLLSTRIELELRHLGFDDMSICFINSVLRKPHGIVLVTGPTGSGKTSTLYTCLNKLNTDNRKIITIEDPVEYNLEGITQMQVKPKIGFTFANGLRSILRHDPDIIMVGEIRDNETAEIAFRSALTGHLVFSTLHTNNSAQAITRLTDIGLEQYLIADPLQGIIAQRLVRVICEQCKRNVQLSSDEKEKYRQYCPHIELPPRVFHGIGCELCNNTGYAGRTVIYEILVIDDDIKSLIHQRTSAQNIRSHAVTKGMKTLFQCGMEKVGKGITTLEEVFKVTYV